MSSHAAWMREKFDDTNPSKAPLGGGYYGEWVGNTTATWMWTAQGQLDGGWSVRRIRDTGFMDQYQSALTAPRLLDHADGTALRLGGFLEQTWSAMEGRVHLSAGARWDRESVDGVATPSAQTSASFLLLPATRVVMGWGQYVQFPELALLASPLGGRGLLPMRANQAMAAIEQRLGARSRVRVEVYDRADRDLPFQPAFDPRIVNGRIFAPPLNPPYYNSLRGYARGAEIFLQRSSANRFTGWISYAYGRTEMREGVTGLRWPSDWDQRHTGNLYAGYRVKPTVNLSVRTTYGSGFPIPGFLRQAGTTYYLEASRNQLRLAPYLRTDARINKSWVRGHWKLTLYGEVINLTNRTNYVFDSLNGYNAKTGQASITLDKMFPVLPSVGVVCER